MPAPTPNLDDPLIFGEDLFAIANRAGELAAVYCGNCKLYHWYVPARRAVGIPKSLDTDRREVASAIFELRKKSAVKNRDYEILVAGAADTGLLATVAHAVKHAEGGALDAAHFTVVDQCRTPLELCLEFSALHGFKCSTVVEDLRTAAPAVPADLVVMHSVLRFLPHEERVKFLERMASWLSPGGQVLISNSYGLEDEGQRGQKAKINQENFRRIEVAIARGLLRAPLPADQLAQAIGALDHASIERDRVFLEPGHLETLAKAAGFEVQNMKLTDAPSESDKVAKSRRVLAILAPKKPA